MSTYIFSPSPTYGTGDHTYVTWENGFSDKEIEDIISIGKSRQIDAAKVSSSNIISPDIRTSSTSWIDLTADSSWLYDRLAYIARCLNGKFYRYDLFGFNEHMQFTIYNSDDKGHYTWHIDTSSGPENTLAPRKLSMVLQLSDPEDYEGGDLELYGSSLITTVTKKRGLVVAFPSYILHRVTPVTKGTRISLVVWITGPAFR